MKIGIFDSGMGGLSVLHRALRMLPEADFLYYADEEHVPYGEKTREQVRGYIDEIIAFMIKKQVDAIVIACNTATSVATKEYRSQFPLPIVGMEPAVKKAFTARVMEHQPPDEPGDYNQALMELGALVCVPNGAPLCEKCPLAHLCAARAAGTALELPRKAAPKPRRLQPVTLALLESPAGFLLQQRPQKGLLAGLWQPVLWEGEALAAGEVLARLQAMGVNTGTAAPEALPAAKHIFSHIEWHMNGILLHVPAQDAPAGCVWASREALQAEYTLPGAFKAYRKLIV